MKEKNPYTPLKLILMLVVIFIVSTLLFIVFMNLFMNLFKPKVLPDLEWFILVYLVMFIYICHFFRKKKEFEKERFPGISEQIIYEPEKPLAKFPEKALFFGVCAGLSRKFKVRPIYFRILFTILTFFYGIGLIAYLILAILMRTRHHGEQNF